MNVKAYFLVFKANLAKDMAYRFNFLFSYVLHITRLRIYLAVWAFIFTDRHEVLNYTWDDIASYYGLCMIDFLLFYPSHMCDLQPLISKGTLSALLIKPINIEANILAKFGSSGFVGLAELNV